MKKHILLISIFLSQFATGQKSFLGIIKSAAPPADEAITFYAGTNWQSNVVGPDVEWSSFNGTTNMCLYTGGYWPASEAGYYYATYKSGSCEEAAIKLMSTDPGTCDPDNPWDVPTRFALFPNPSPANYRVWGDIDGFTVTAQTYLAGDLYGLFRAAGGTVTAQYLRTVPNGGSGAWVTIHTFTQTSTAQLWAGGGGLSYTTLVNPMASANFVPSPPPMPLPIALAMVLKSIAA